MRRARRAIRDYACGLCGLCARRHRRRPSSTRSRRRGARPTSRRCSPIPAFYHGRPIVIVGNVGARRRTAAARVRRQRIDPAGVQGHRARRPRRSARRVLGHRPDEAGRHPAAAPTICARRSRSIPTAPGRGRAGDGDHRDRGRAGGAAGAAPSIRAIVLQPVAVSRSEGHDHRPVLRTQPARRSAGRARQEPLRLRAALGRRRHLGDQHAAEGQGRERQGLRARRSTRGSTPGAGCRCAARCSRRAASWLDAEAGSLALAEAADRDRTPTKSRSACRPAPPPEVVFSAPTEDETDVSHGDHRADSVLARHRSGDAEGAHPARAISSRRPSSAASR